jgi:hypothetical protein
MLRLMDDARGTPPRVLTGPRLVAAGLATAGLVALPLLVALSRLTRSGLAIDTDLVGRRTVFAAVFCAIGWGVLWGLAWAVRAIARSTPPRQAVSDPALIAAVLAGHDVACGRCGRSLRGETGSRCPGCGAPVVIALDWDRVPRPLVWVVKVACAGCAAQAMIAIPIMVTLARFFLEHGSEWRYGRVLVQNVSAPLLAITGFAWLAVEVWRWYRRRDRLTDELGLWRLATIAVGLMLAVPVVQEAANRLVFLVV